MSAFAQEADRIGREAADLVDDGDRTWYTIPGISAPFGLGKDQAVQVTFNNPADADFYGMCMNLYYQYRVIDPTNAANSDLVFRPCVWSSWACNQGASAFANPGHEGNGTVTILDDAAGPYQNVPFSVASMYSGPYGIFAGQNGPPISLYPGALRFHRPYFLSRGKAMALLYTPLFTSGFNLLGGGSPSVVPPFTLEFRVTGVFEGYKKVTALF